jgi:hypothetical protein
MRVYTPILVKREGIRDHVTIKLLHIGVEVAGPFKLRILAIDTNLKPNFRLSAFKTLAEVRGFFIL